MKIIINELQFRLIAESMNIDSSGNLIFSEPESFDEYNIKDILLKRIPYRVLSEQGGFGVYGVPGSRSLERGVQSLTDLYKSDPHLYNTILGIGTSFIPFIGPFISAGIGAADASLYYKEGDKMSASLAGIFFMLPLIGKIPAVRNLGERGIKNIVSKLKNRGKGLTKSELGVINQIKNSEGVIRDELMNAGKRLAPLTKQIYSLKPVFIDRYGKGAYEKLLREYITGVIDDKSFIGALSGGGKAAPNLANFVSKFGIKFSKQEIKQITNITAWVNKLPTKLVKPFLDNTLYVDVATKTGVKRVNINFIDTKTAVKWYGESLKDYFAFALGDEEIYLIVDNAKKMSKIDLEQLLFHEFAHIKDPGKVSSVLNNRYLQNVVRHSKEYFSKGYYFHPKELIANTSKILNGLSVNTERSMKLLGRDRTLQVLDDIVNWSKGIKKDFSEDMVKLLGYNEKYVKQHFDFLSKKPNEYKKLAIKIAQQAEYLKSQVKLAL